MSKASAEEFSRAGDRYIGTPYAEMDCQAFVEACLRVVGITLDLRGSNAWYRKIRSEGWTGTPEECAKLFGEVPKGAFLFILKDDGGEVARGYRDGLGNASHIGIKTGRGEGAIHSSQSRGSVVESKFKDKTISGGGWNRIGLWNRLDYGKSINFALERMSGGTVPAEGQTEEEKNMMVTVFSENGKPVNFRKTKGGDLIDKVPVGTSAELLDAGDGEWAKIRIGKNTGWMMTKFLVADDSAIPAEDPDDFNAGDAAGDDEPDDRDGGEKIPLYFTVEELAMLLPVLEKAVEQIVDKVGRG